MSNFPDFSQHGYQIISQLGENHLGGRVTYLAERQNSQNQTDKVVIKQFQFAQMGATWAEYDAYSQEITMLRQLNHPGIAKYIDAFQTPDGFCMVQQYLKAESLATPRSWTPKQIKLLAESVLEILVYLQSQNPPIIHRDIKPENILVDEKDEQMRVYLVDFGFARMGGGEIAASSVVKGTMGFMPPEQLFNRQLTNASDLYGLGGTLICLLTGTKSVDIGNLIDADYRIKFRHLVPPVKRGLINWLEKLTDPRLTHRYSSAAEALVALQPIDVDRLPKVRFNHQNLEITATDFGQILTETITITNPIPETTLSGRFSVAPHPSDPPHTPYDHAWISFNPQQFSGNEVECKITIDTSKLVANETYTREVLLDSNSASDIDRLTVNLQTAPLPSHPKPSYWFMLSLFIASFFGGRLLSLFPILLVCSPGLISFVVAIETTQWAQANKAKVDFFYNFAFAFLGNIAGMFFAGYGANYNLVRLLLSMFAFSGFFSFLFVSKYIGINYFVKLSLNLISFIRQLIFILVLMGMLFVALMLMPLWFLCLIIGCLTLTIFLKQKYVLIISIRKFIFGLYMMLMQPIINLLNLQTPHQIVSLMTGFLGICLGAGCLTYVKITENLGNLSIEKIFWIAGLGLITVLITSIPLISYLIQQMQQANNIAKYRRFESTLIKP